MSDDGSCHAGEARYVAIIADGNRRWARTRGLPLNHGHDAGAVTLRARLRDAVEWGIKELTVFSFSTENWCRPADEVRGLMTVFAQRIASETAALHRAATADPRPIGPPKVRSCPVRLPGIRSCNPASQSQMWLGSEQAANGSRTRVRTLFANQIYPLRAGRRTSVHQASWRSQPRYSSRVSTLGGGARTTNVHPTCEHSQPRYC